MGKKEILELLAMIGAAHERAKVLEILQKISYKEIRQIEIEYFKQKVMQSCIKILDDLDICVLITDTDGKMIMPDGSDTGENIATGFDFNNPDNGFYKC